MQWTFLDVEPYNYVSSESHFFVMNSLDMSFFLLYPHIALGSLSRFASDTEEEQKSNITRAAQMLNAKSLPDSWNSVSHG